MSRRAVAECARWEAAFSGKRKDRRFYELLEDTVPEGYDYRYLALRDGHGEVRAVQPFFLLDQDLLAGSGVGIVRLADAVRGLWPSFLKVRTLMLGCVAGEGHLDGSDLPRDSIARLLAGALVREARRLKAPMIVLKEFPAEYRTALRCLVDAGFTRVPSLPMTHLDIDYPRFEDYMARALNSATRRKLRKKFGIAAAAPPITMTILVDAAPIVDEIYPLYLQVYERSKLHFEKLTRAFFCELGRRMPDVVRFFVWRQEGKIVAFILAMIEGDALYAEYIGLDYAVALKLHLYHYAVRDIVSWAMANGYKWFRSSALNYDPKLHLRHRLDPIDLYVRHTSPVANAVLKRVLPLIEPTRRDPILKKFANYHELWGEP